MSDLGSEYLFSCLAAYKSGHWPGDPRTGVGAQVQAAADEFIEMFGPAVFGGFLQEYQYAVNLWTAHVLVEQNFGDEALRTECWEVIHRHAAGAINEDCRASEAQWLKRWNEK